MQKYETTQKHNDKIKLKIPTTKKGFEITI